MLQRFIRLEFKSFFRSSSLAANIVVKIFQLLGMLYILALFVFLAFGAFYFPKQKSTRYEKSHKQLHVSGFVSRRTEQKQSVKQE